MADKGQGAREHARVVAEVLATCGARTDCRIWPNNSGVGRGLNHDGVIHFGLKGSADILGIVCGGFFLAIEVKTGGARQTKQQLAFEEMIGGFGGYYLVVHSGEDAKAKLDSLLNYLLYTGTK